MHATKAAHKLLPGLLAQHTVPAQLPLPLTLVGSPAPPIICRPGPAPSKWWKI